MEAPSDGAVQADDAAAPSPWSRTEGLAFELAAGAEPEVLTTHPVVEDGPAHVPVETTTNGRSAATGGWRGGAEDCGDDTCLVR